MSDLEKRAVAFIKEHKLACEGGEIAVALSGGADSVCLLLVLDACREELGIRLSALHLNHALRGAEADADEAFCRALCEEKNIPFVSEKEDIAALAKAQGLGTEEAGRLARRRLYATKDIVALAHHSGDRAETFLFRAARGSALAGLSGMREKEALDDSGAIRTRLIRPLLFATRAEIEAYLKERQQPWREDATNECEDFTRNAIRRSVLPLLAEKVNPEAARHLAEAAESLALADDFLREEATKRGGEYIRRGFSEEGEEPEEEILLFEEIRKLPEVLQGYLAAEAVRLAAGSTRDIGRLHLRQLLSLFALPVGKKAQLPGGLTAVRERDHLRLRCGKKHPPVVQ